MAATATNISAQRVKLSVCQLEGLIAHPACIAGCLEALFGSYPNDRLRLCIESDPAIALAVIELCRDKDIALDFANLNFSSLLGQIPKSELLKTILGLDIYDSENSQKLDLIRDLTLRSGSRAFAARLIAQKSSPALASAAFVAGLFSDIGLLALAQLYTKSASMLVEESKGSKDSLLLLEKEHLGITDNILSNQLLTKLRFGADIADAVWLHPKATETIIAQMPAGKLIAIVRLADILSGLAIQNDISSLTKYLFLTDSDVSQIRQKTADYYLQAGKLFGFENKDPQRAYLEAIKNIYFKELSAGGGEDNFTQFAKEFLNALNPQGAVFEITQTSAEIFSRFFLSQRLSVFAADAVHTDLITACVIDGIMARSVLINCPDGFSISGAAKEDFQPWLFEQIGIESEKSHYIPIENGGQTVAGIILQGPMPDTNLLGQITALLGKVFTLANNSERQKAIAEIVLNSPKELQPPAPAAPAVAEPQKPVGIPIERQDIIQTAAELAAGAAHELNNPLAVISGRAQLLLQDEADETRRQILSQIVEKTGAIEEIIGQLMCYAKPPAAQIRAVSPFIIINNCLEKVNARYLSEPLDIHLENIENLSDIEVDPDQIAESLAQIIYNALESYESGNGPVHIIGAEQGDTVEICISDYGCGMSEEAIAKATEPFFSDKPAGRQRGMGLSIASGLLKNNNCILKIQSHLDRGTKITLNLPRAGKSENS
jgi:signal transduction histidine kinase